MKDKDKDLKEQDREIKELKAQMKNMKSKPVSLYKYFFATADYEFW